MCGGTHLANHRGYERHLRGHSADIIVHCLHVAARHDARRIGMHYGVQSALAQARAKKIESKPTAKGGGSVSSERIQRCMQSSHLQVSILRMHLCAAYLSPMQCTAPTLKDKRWRVRRKNNGQEEGKGVVSISHQFTAVL